MSSGRALIKYVRLENSSRGCDGFTDVRSAEVGDDTVKGDRWLAVARRGKVLMEMGTHTYTLV